MTAPIELFRHCPKCGQPVARVPAATAIRCGACGLLYYINPTVAVSALVIRGDGRVLFIRRAKEPGKGMLGLPGGFVDINESAEDALRREVREEVGVELAGVEFFGSYPNHYPYAGVTYPVCDLFYLATPVAADAAAPLDDVESVCWLAREEIRLEALAFHTAKLAVGRWLASGAVARASSP